MITLKQDNVITGNVKHVVCLRFKNASEVYNLHFEISDLIFPHEKCIDPYKNVN